ncbi:DUF1768 domain-containing protein [Mycena indigotica]|uniref:DUF1768 domain-containing protein n=1 Tax=Mycena indigotica TaxID=2126181 RepID=A0A8H6WFB3_9AGAR|nr:DUF1768 domain-containing protein [Mycena indigotica]KAF7312708.1 DUF1768 domain-containing protein [Mycena indigotica]
MQSPTPIIVTRTSSKTTMVSPWDSPEPSPTSPNATSPMHYRIEQRRSIYVTTDVLPSQWDTAQLNNLLDIGETIAEQAPSRDIRIRLTRSMPERPVLFYPELEAKAPTEIVEQPKRATAYRARDSVALSPKSPVISPPIRRSGGSPRTPTRTRILFYHKTDPHYGFTNFSAHPVFYDNKRYPTSEHLFQSFKFMPHRPKLAEHIRTCSERPSVAFSEARRFAPEVRSDWKDVNIQMMDIALWHKFTQHESLKKELLATDDAELIEDSDKDAFWGIGADRKGRNELGKALERLRTKLRGY